MKSVGTTWLLVLAGQLSICGMTTDAAKAAGATALSRPLVGDHSQAPSAPPKEGKKADELRTSPPASPKKDESADPQDPTVYRIGVEDDLQISVWKEPDLSTTVVVRPDGKITMPLLNDISVVGLQTSELQALLTEKLKPYVNEPQVTVIVRGIKSRKVFVFGQVARIGAYPLVGSKTVLELLAEAGGLGPFAKKGSIYILREIDHKKVQIPFNYNDALKGKNPKESMELHPGDVVVVP